MKATTRQISVALAILTLVVIASNYLSFFYLPFHRVYVPQDSQEMEWMEKQLEAKGIRYWIDDENHIAISSDDNALYDPFISKIQDDRRLFSQGFGSSDKEYMKILMKELERAGIEYRIDYKDEIRYMEHDRPRFKSIKSKVDDMLVGGIPKTFSDKPKRERFIYLLRKEGVEYTVLNQTDGGWIKWRPRTEYQKKKILDEFQSYDPPFQTAQPLIK